MIRFNIILSIICVNVLLKAQQFNVNTSKHPLSFREQQQQFSSFMKTHDLSKEKHWKYFMHWEADMRLHTNTEGEPAGFDDYNTEAVKMAEWKDENSSMPVNWLPTGPNALPSNLTGYMENGIGRVNCIAFHPTNQNIFYIGVAQGGLWKTTNGGTSYTPLTDNLPVTRISDICLDPNDPNTIYISVCDFEYIGTGLYLDGRKRNTHYGVGIYKSTDGGLSWAATGLTYQLTNGEASLVRKIIVNPANSSEVISCGVNGIYRSSNGGGSWTQKMDSLFWDMVQDPVSPSTLYAASGWVQSAGLGNAGIYRSTDFGNTWTLLNTGIPATGVVQRIKLAIAPSDHNFIYAVCCDNTKAFHGVYHSQTAGSSWIFKPALQNILEAGTGGGTGGQGTYDLALIVDKTNKNKIYVGGVNIWGSADNGANFNPVSHWTLNYGPTLHGDIHMLERQPGTDLIFACTDGGTYKTSNIQTGSWSSNLPTTWTGMNNGLQVTSFYRLSSSKTAAGVLLAGSQDNASVYYNGSWRTVFGGDGMDNYIDPSNPSHIIGSSQFGTFFNSNNGGASGNYISTNPNNEASDWTTPIAASYSGNVIYIANENLVKSVDGGNNWIPLATIFTNSLTQANTEASALAVAPTNSQVVYAARRVRHEFGLRGMVFKTNSGGSSVTKITGNLPDSLYFTSIDVSPLSSNEACITMAGFSAGRKVYRTTDGGSTWTNITYNLPNIPVNCVKYLPGTTNRLVLATDLGVYTLESGAVSWVNNSLGLPNVIVSDIEINPALNKIFISTFGRGIWEANYLNLFTGAADQRPAQADFQIFPTVNDSRFSLILPEGSSLAFVDVFDVQGKNVFHSNLLQKENRFDLNIEPGVYYLRVTDGNRIGVKRMIVQ
jgi:photosystem II stability/assembly factor-like uncharacterized protein